MPIVGILGYGPSQVGIKFENALTALQVYSHLAEKVDAICCLVSTLCELDMEALGALSVVTVCQR